MQAQDAFIFLHYAMFAVPLMLLLLVPLIVSELQAMRPQVAYAVSGFVVIGRKSRVGILYGARFERVFQWI